MTNTLCTCTVQYKYEYITDEESYSAANSIGRKFLYNSRVLYVISLLVKYYVPLAHINKVINFSSLNLQ